MSKEIESLKTTQTVQNEKYQNFLKEKLIFQTERDHMVNEIKNIEGLMQHQQYKTMDEIAAHKS